MVFSPSARSQCRELVPAISERCRVDKNATSYGVSLTVTVACRGSVSPLRYLIATVAREPEPATLLSVRVPPSSPPMYPAASDALHSLQEMTSAPLPSSPLSPSIRAVSEGADHVPAATSGAQLSCHSKETSVPEMVRGNQT